MFAIAAIIVFILGLILNLLGIGYNWPLAFLGLALLSIHFIWAWTPWRSNPTA